MGYKITKKIILLALVLPLYLDSQDTTTLLKEALKFTKSQNYEDAAKIFKKVLDQEPENLTALQGIGVSFIFLKKYKDSFYFLNKALKIDPNNVTTLMSLARLYEEQEIFYKAHFYYNRVLQLDSYQLEAYLGQGRVYNKDRQYRNALGVLGKVLKLDPYHAAALEGMAFAYRRLSLYNEAVVSEKKILEIDPDNVNAMVRIADIYETLGDQKSAIVWYEKAKKKAPKNENIYVKLSILYSKTDQIEAATTVLRQAIQLQEGNISNYNTLGRVYGWLSQLDEAYAIFEKAAQIDPKNTAVLNDLALISLFQGRWDKAEEMYKKVLSLEPKNLDALKGLDLVKIEKNPLFTSRFNYINDENRDAIVNDTRTIQTQFSEEFIYKLNPSTFIEGRGQRNDRYQVVDNHTRDHDYYQNIASLKLQTSFGNKLTLSSRGEYNHFGNDGTNSFNFRSRTFNRLSGYTYLLYEKGNFFGAISARRGLVLRQVLPNVLKINPFDDFGLSLGLDFKKSLEAIVRYNYIDLREQDDQHDVEGALTWDLPFLKKVEVGYAFEWINDPQEEIHKLSAEFKDQLFNKLLVDLLYKFSIDNNNTDRGTTYVHTYKLLLSLPLYKKITFNFDGNWEFETGQDTDIFQTYRLYLQLPFGVF